MTCICGESWCWTCGFATDSWIHRAQFANGVLCIFINSFLVGYELTFHLNWLLRLVIFLICVTLFPVGFFFYILAFTMREFKDSSCFGNPDCWLSLHHSHHFVTVLLLILPVNLGAFSCAFVISVVICMVITCLVTASLLISLVYVVPSMLFRSISYNFDPTAQSLL